MVKDFSTSKMYVLDAQSRRFMTYRLLQLNQGYRYSNSNNNSNRSLWDIGFLEQVSLSHLEHEGVPRSGGGRASSSSAILLFTSARPPLTTEKAREQSHTGANHAHLTPDFIFIALFH